jgi:hypothetical protein
MRQCPDQAISDEQCKSGSSPSSSEGVEPRCVMEAGVVDLKLCKLGQMDQRVSGVL